MTTLQEGAALSAFEASIRADSLMGPVADEMLKKLDSHDPHNPEFLYRVVDARWVQFRNGWIACEIAMRAAPQELPQ